MGHKLRGLLLLLLVPPLILGQTLEGKLMVTDDNSTSQLHTVFHSSDNRTFNFEEADHNVTYEDQESFQDQEKIHLHWTCDEMLMMKYGEICWNTTFHTDMVELGEKNWCDWDMVIGHYNLLTLCLEVSAEYSRCYFPGPIIQKLFMDIHQQYFSSCSSEEEEAPESVVLILTLLPVSIIPIAVYMVICRSNVKE